MDNAVEDLEAMPVDGHRYVGRATVAGEESVDVTAPFDVRLCPWDLTRDLRPE